MNSNSNSSNTSLYHSKEFIFNEINEFNHCANNK